MGKKMIAVNFLVVFLLLIITLICLCSCEFNIYLPVEKPVPEHEHNKDKLVQDGEEGHHWECTVCGLKTDTEPHTYNSNNICTVCGYNKLQGQTGSGGFVVNIIMKEPMGHINAEFNKTKKKWVFTLVDDRGQKSQEDYPITKWTWSVFDEKKSTKKTFELETPYEISYEIKCRYENKYGYGSCTLVILGRTQ